MVREQKIDIVEVRTFEIEILTYIKIKSLKNIEKLFALISFILIRNTTF